jgi:hypothetical protein
MNTENATPAGDQNQNGSQPGATATDATGQQATATATDAGGADGQGDGGKPPATAGEAGGAGGDGQQSGQQPGANAEGAATGEQPAPEPPAYVDFTLPEGFTLEGERRDQAHSLFRDLGLDQYRAQKLVDWYVAEKAAEAGSVEAAIQQAVDTQREEWGRQAVAELGDRYQEEMSYARTAVNAVGSPKLEAAFIELGWGNHPELVKAFALFGRMMRDSPIDTGRGGAAQAEKPLHERMYPGMK